MKFQFFSKHDESWVDFSTLNTLADLIKMALQYHYKIRVLYDNGNTVYINL